jgi:hypothetical protein
METWNNLLFLLLVPGISLFTALVLSNITRKQALENRRNDRKSAAREIRLKKGEEMIKVYTRDFYFSKQLIQQLINVKSSREIQAINKREAEYEKTREELDKGRTINEVSVKSLEDEKLTKAMEKIQNSFNAYIRYYYYLFESLQTKGGSHLQEEFEKNAEKELSLRKSYDSSVREFHSRINELRSQ